LQMVAGDKDGNGKLTRAEFTGVADQWYDKLDAGRSGRIAQAEFPARFAALPPVAMPTGRGGGNNQGPATDLSPDTQVGTWPEFNRMLGGFFKFHWNDGQVIHYKIDEPDHPLNAPFKGLSDFQVVDETYTMSRNTYSRQNLRVLTSVDYAKMSAEDKAKEQNPRSDGDYALSWIRREGKGRVFYEAHGHNERVYAIKPLLEHITAGMQYVLGDFDVDDRPSVKGEK
jgi:type 1 glutamine amidotransferase